MKMLSIILITTVMTVGASFGLNKKTNQTSSINSGSNCFEGSSAVMRDLKENLGYSALEALDVQQDLQALCEEGEISFNQKDESVTN